MRGCPRHKLDMTAESAYPCADLKCIATPVRDKVRASSPPVGWPACSRPLMYLEIGHRLRTMRDATSPNAGYQPVRHAGRIVGITGQITLQYPIFNDGAPHQQDERDWGDEGRP